MPSLLSLPRIASCVALFAIALPHADRLSAADVRHRLAIASWNLEWLADPAVLIAAKFWNLCKARGWPNEKMRADLPFCDVYRSNGIRTAADYATRTRAARGAGRESQTPDPRGRRPGGRSGTSGAAPRSE